MLLCRARSVACTQLRPRMRCTTSTPRRNAHFRVGISPGFGASPLIFQSFSRKETLREALSEVIDEIHTKRKNYAHMSSAVDLDKPPGLVLLNSSVHYMTEHNQLSELIPPSLKRATVAYQKFHESATSSPLVCGTVVYLPHDSNEKLKIQQFQADTPPPPEANHISFWVAPGNRRVKDKLLREGNSLRAAVECAGPIYATGEMILKGAVTVHYADLNQEWFAKVMRMHFGHEFFREVYSDGDLEFNIMMRKQMFMPRNLIPSSMLDHFTPRSPVQQPTVIQAKKPVSSVPSVLPILNINLQSQRFALYPHASVYHQELQFSNLALSVLLKDAFEARSWLLLADRTMQISVIVDRFRTETYNIGFVSAVTYMYVHLIPERGSNQATLRLEYVIAPSKRCKIVSSQPMPETFGGQQAEIELIEDEPVYATAELEALRKRIASLLETYPAELLEVWGGAERLEEARAKLNSSDHANFSWLVASILSSRPFLAPETAAKEWLECTSVSQRYALLLKFLENYRKKLPSSDMPMLIKPK